MGTTAPVQRKRYLLKAIFWLLAILLGALQAWANRYSISSEDGISYLDIGDAYFRGEWNAAVNAYWSPLYSWLLGLAIFALKPSPYWEFAVVKLVNFLIYLVALVCFEFFLRELIFYYRNQISQRLNRSLKLPEWACLVSGYTLFIWSSLEWIRLDNDAPDMGTAALIYLATGIVLRLHTRSESWFNFIMLGAVLGFGYLCKAVIFPLAFVFLIVGMFSAGNLRQALPRVLAALLVFTIVVSPFIVAISIAKGHLTFGETGKINYAWSVNPGSFIVPDHHWQGGPPGSNTPKHPTRKIFDNPPAFEFGTPLGGTYPPWYDPSYWYEGLTVKFALVKQINILATNTRFYYKLFFARLVFGYLILISLGGRFWTSVKYLTANWMLLIPAAAGLGIYMLGVNMPLAFRQTRYIAPFIVLLFSGVFSSVRLADSPLSKRLIAGITIATLIIVSSQLYLQTAKDLVTIFSRREHTHYLVAEGLHTLGIQPGEKVAQLGGFKEYYWARLARVKIVAEIPDARKFWAKDAVTRAEVLKTIEKTGARVIVQKPRLNIPDSAAATGWKKLGNTDSYAYFLRKPGIPPTPRLLEAQL